MKLTVARCGHTPLFTALLVKKSSAKPIDRERKAIKKQRMKLRKVVRDYLASAAPGIAKQIIKAVSATRKSEEDDRTDGVLAELTFDWAVLQDSVTPILRSILEDSGAEALAQVGIETVAMFDLVNEMAVKYADERAAELVTNISESTRNMLRADVSDALQTGTSNDGLAATIGESYGFSADRAEVIARTETAYADVQGNLATYRLTEVVEKKQWITGADCCDLCDELNGETIDLDEMFDSDDGPIDGPPYHPNCRCDVLPVRFDDQSDPENDS